MIPPWQLSTWYLHEFLIKISKSKCKKKKINRSRFPPTCPSWHPPLSFLYLSKWHHIYSVADWKLRKLCFIILVWVTPLIWIQRLLNDLLVCMLILTNLFSLSLHSILFIFCIHTPIHFSPSCVSFKQISDTFIFIRNHYRYMYIYLYICAYVHTFLFGKHSHNGIYLNVLILKNINYFWTIIQFSIISLIS